MEGENGDTVETERIYGDRVGGATIMEQGNRRERGSGSESHKYGGV